MRLLIDGDGLIYRCGFAVEKTKYLITHGDDGDVPSFIWAQYDSHKEAKADLKNPEYQNNFRSPVYVWSRRELEPIENAFALVKGALEAMPDGQREIYLSPSVGNFRDRIATIAKYKGNRDAARRPEYYSEIRDLLIRQYAAVTTMGQEADDALGIEQSRNRGETCIVSFDKDLDQIPGRHYNWITKEAYEISPREGDFNFYAQILSGDPTDNVLGLPGIGPVKARKELEGATSTQELWKRVLECYEAEYGEFGYDTALETARLVYVRRKDEEIWTPPTQTKAEAA